MVRRMNPVRYANRKNSKAKLSNGVNPVRYANRKNSKAKLSNGVNPVRYANRKNSKAKLSNGVNLVRNFDSPLLEKNGISNGVNPDLSVRIGKIRLSNPVMVASGTFGYAEEFKDLINLRKLGAIVTKSITLKPTKGNPPPRICETPSGMLNAIGLQNNGVEDFLKSKLPFLKRIGVPIIVSIAGRDKDEFVELAKRLDKIGIDAIELNISCPNIRGLTQITSRINADHPRKFVHYIRENPRLIAQDVEATYAVVRAVRKATRLTLITKLSPNVTDIIPIAKATVRAGTDALALVNTFTGMSIDIETRTPRLGNITGGLSGPAIKPIAIRMVWEVAREVDAPIIGMGGIMNAEDALEFIIAGATAVAVGTANLVNPKASVEIIEGIKEYIVKNNIKKISNLTGTLKI